MNQLFTKKMKAIVFLGTMGVLSFTLVAKPALKTIKAYINPSISYTLDGQKVLGDVKTITYDNKTYVPLADVAKIAGLQTKFENNTIIMTKGTIALPQLPAPQTTTPATVVVPAPVTTPQVIDVKEVITSYENVKIVQVDNSGKYIIIQAEGKQIKALFDNKTKVNYEDSKKQPNANSLKAGQTVDIKLASTTASSEGSVVKILEIKVKDNEVKIKEKVIKVEEKVIKAEDNEIEIKGNKNKTKGK